MHAEYFAGGNVQPRLLIAKEIGCKQHAYRVLPLRDGPDTKQ